MKKFSFLFAILAVVLVFGFVFVGCNSGTDNTDPKTLRITGVTGVLSERLIFMLYAEEEGVLPTAGMNESVNGTITGQLYNGSGNGFYSAPGYEWTGIGEYFIAVWESSGGSFGGYPKYRTPTRIKFDKTTTTVPWSQFVLTGN